MATFPDIVGAPSGYQRTSTYRNAQSSFGEGRANPVRYRKWLRQRYAFALSWNLLTSAQAKAIEDFIISVNGIEDDFDWFDWKPQFWRWVPVATGDGSTVSFDIPGKDTSDHEFLINGITPATGTVTPGAGADGADRVTLNAAPAAGYLLTVSFYGRRRFTVSFDEAIGELEPDADSETFSLNVTLHQSK